MKYFVLICTLALTACGSESSDPSFQSDQSGFSGYYQFDSNSFRISCITTTSFTASERTEILYLTHSGSSLAISRNPGEQSISERETISSSGSYEFTVNNGEFQFTYSGSLASTVNYNGSVAVATVPESSDICFGEALTTVTRL